jgi:hypothetical protein
MTGSAWLTAEGCDGNGGCVAYRRNRTLTEAFVTDRNPGESLMA